VGDELNVECHSGFTYAERPTAFTYEGKRHIIVKIIRQETHPQGKFFQVVNADGMEWRLLYDENSDCWQNVT
jgi:hypothetical protein